jgi:hypothetical protein
VGEREGRSCCSSILLFVGFSDDRRLKVVRFGVFVFVLGIIIVVGVSRRIVLPMMGAKL